MTFLGAMRATGSARLMLDFARQHGIDDETVLRGTGLHANQLEDPLGEIHTRQELRLIENLVADLDVSPPPGLAAGRRYTVSTFGMLGFALMSSPSMIDALRFGLRYQDLALSFVKVDLLDEGGHIRLVLNADHLPQSIRRFAIDHEIGVLWTVFSALGGRPPQVLEASLGYPVDDLEPYTELLGTTPRPGGFQTSIQLSAADMYRPLPQADEAALHMCESQCVRLRERRRDMVGVTGLVYENLARESRRPPTQATIARTLNTSPRSLRRHLAAEGKSFRRINERARCQRAERLLADGNLTIAAIAELTGYASASALTHAFKRWHGETPGAFRDRQRLDRVED